MKETLIIYRDWWEAIRNLPPELRFKAFDSICEYAFEGKQPEDPILGAVTALMRSTIDRDRAKYEEICNKRSKAIQARWKKYKSIQENTNEYKCKKSIQENTSITDNEYENEYDNDNGLISSHKDINNLREGFLKKYLLENQISLEAFLKNNSMSLENFKSFATEVLIEWELSGWRPIKFNDKHNEAFTSNHFLNQIRKKYNIKNNGTTNRNNGSAETYKERNRKFQEHIIQKLNTPHQEQDISGNY